MHRAPMSPSEPAEPFVKLLFRFNENNTCLEQKWHNWMTKWQNRTYDKFKKTSLFYRFLIRSCYSGNFWMKLQNLCVIILVHWRQHQKVQMKYFWWQHRMTKWHLFRLKSNNENVRDDLDHDIQLSEILS